MIQVIIIEKLLLIGEVLATLLRDEPDIRVVGLVTSATKAFEYLEATRCDVVILGNSFSKLKTLKMTLQIAEKFPAIKILVFSTLEADSYPTPYLEAGAAGCICGQHSVDELLRLVRAPTRLAAASTTLLPSYPAPV
jgi:DNA-binding NarL/FixJ family response regulator